MTHSTAAEVFEQQAREYDAVRRRLLPPFDAFYGTAVEAVAIAGPAPRRILDLGAGTGLLARRLAAAYPTAELVLLDGAAAMLDEARAALGHRARYVQADLGDELPAGPWDAAVSALAIHHLDDAAKRTLFARVRAALRPGGVFVNAEQVAGPTPFLDEVYERWHHASASALGASEEEWAGAVERMRYDRCSDVESQLAWLREAGFVDVDCPFKQHRFAVLLARRPD